MKTNCPVCSADNQKAIHVGFRGNDSLSAYKCSSCGLIYSSKVNKTTQKELDRFYENEYSKNYYEGEKLAIEKNFADKLPYQTTRTDRLGEVYQNAQNILEIGCGPGYFLHRCKKDSKTSVGVEKNINERKYVNEVLDIECYDNINMLKDEKFDLIMLNQVLEHVVDPVAFIKEHFPLLRKGGYLVVEVPSASNAIVSLYDSEEFKSFWFQDPHLYYFSIETLKSVISKATEEKIVDAEIFQETSFSNHYNWAVHGQKTKVRSEAISDDFPIQFNDNSLLKSELDNLYRDFNIGYKRLLCAHGYGDIISATVSKK